MRLWKFAEARGKFQGSPAEGDELIKTKRNGPVLEASFHQVLTGSYPCKKGALSVPVSGVPHIRRTSQFLWLPLVSLQIPKRGDPQTGTQVFQK